MSIFKHIVMRAIIEMVVVKRAVVIMKVRIVKEIIIW